MKFKVHCEGWKQGNIGIMSCVTVAQGGCKHTTVPETAQALAPTGFQSAPRSPDSLVAVFSRARVDGER